jgi:group I intron endonuclease
MVIYCIENKLNNKKYVGITKGCMLSRFKTHKRIAKYKETKQHLHKAMIQDGINNFIVYEIDTAESKEQLFEKEKYWIKTLDTKNSGYNETDGGEGTWGWKPSPEKQKILNERQREIWKNNPELRINESKRAKEVWNNLTEEEKKKRTEVLDSKRIGNQHAKGKTWNLSEETKKKISEAKKGWIMPEEAKKKISAARMGENNPNYGRKHSPETIEKMRQSALNRKRIGT